MNRFFQVTILIIICFFSQASDISAFYLSSSIEEGTIILRSDNRPLIQGDLLKISLEAPSLLRAEAHFDGLDVPFVSTGKDTGFFALIGAGLETVPGAHDLRVDIFFSRNRHREFTVRLNVAEGTFPQRKITVARKYVAPLPAEELRIKKERAIVNAAYRNPELQWRGTGGFIYPVKGGISGTFGDKRLFNNGYVSRHRGIDLRSPRGKEVHASNGGTVVLVHDLYYAGKTVIINHGAGLFSIYCHLSKAHVKKGNTIRKGAVIGRIGSTGRVTGPHLHWGIKLRNRFVNPLSLMHIHFD